jgi:2-dehydro-3-deoxygalactonokinase
MRPREFFSCDWGTSSFRLRLVDREEGRAVAETRDGAGARSIFESSTPETRAGAFAAFIGPKLEEIAGGFDCLNAPLVISGMASSSIGWQEIPYAQAPFSLDGFGLRVEELKWTAPPWLGPTFLVSGVATEREMMRGEETQALGLMARPELARFRGAATLALPGTHSKHLRIENSAVVDFRTFMTGELFEVMAKQSILRATVDGSSAVADSEVFREGARLGAREKLLGNLFQARTRGVLGKATPAENAAFLSGLLIGAELSELDWTRPVIIAAGANLAEAYAIALETIAPPEAARVHVQPSFVDEAIMAAHRLILERL